MWCEVFIRLLLAHVVGDFLFQTDYFCRKKIEGGLCGLHIYLHSLLIFILSWIALWSFSSWWLALILGVAHLLIDSVKKRDNLASFLIDQVVHVMCIGIVVCVVMNKGLDVVPNHNYEWVNIVCLYALAFLLNGKPTNLLIKHLLRTYSVQSPQESDGSNESIRSGKLIGNLERWLIILFMLCGQYEAIGFLIAAKSIIRYKDGDTSKTEYVLAGTLISVFVAVLSGLLLMNITCNNL